MNAGRLELKYCVSERVAAHVLDVARGYLIPDPLALGPRQRVTSLYVDTPDLLFLRWHHEHAADRYKLRIRGYGELPGSTLYAEVKRKTASVVRKHRTPFLGDQLTAVLGQYRTRFEATPQVLVTGIREALRDPRSENAVTVDRALQRQPARRIDLAGEPGDWTPLVLPRGADSSHTLVELKYGTLPPAWMELLIRTLAPSRVSFSKYAAAMSRFPHVNPEPATVRFSRAQRIELT